MASERPVITSCVARRARVALVTPSSELRGPPVPTPRITAISSHTSSTAGWRGDGVIFSPPLPDRDRAWMARSRARSIRSASSRSVASQSTTGRGVRPASHGSIHGAAIRPPLRSMAKISTSGHRAS